MTWMYAMNVILGEILQCAELIKNEIKLETLKEEIGEEESIPTEAEFEEIKNAFIEMAKLSFPIAVQNMILENIGTPKLEMAINESLSQRKDKPFEKFMFIFLKCDLKIGNIYSDLNRYIKNEMSESILKLILTKLAFYYRMRFFGTDMKMDNNLLDLIIEIYIKLSPEDSKMEQTFKSNRVLFRKEIKKKIDKEGKIY